MTHHDPALSLWRDTATCRAIVAFVKAVTSEGPSFVAPADRIAVFDNDGTLWCEKPLPVQLDFILRRLAADAEREPSLRTKEPWRSAYARDFSWLDRVIVNHYRGDDDDLKVMTKGVLDSFAGAEVIALAAEARAFFSTATNAELGLPHVACAFAPMRELLDYLRANRFTTCIVSGGGRDFIRGIARQLYGVEPEQVIGSMPGLRWVDDGRGGKLVFDIEPGVLDDGPQKPVAIWNRLGRRPIFVAGNANGDLPMMRFAQGGACRDPFRLLVVHDDDEREFAYTAGAEEIAAAAASEGWITASMRRDWETVFRP